ncbi:putative selenate ABC transporter substrate-binding protein [Aestuariicella hydrocarbonica]|uniref:Selenate ABC transporter substrate-binding protein n=1 Tax=Pseudomaricurvus hydrocarbonicus TaxID=1470433 RepID=A0A9E5MKQ2_9GAMM|nr:putative selenate ABC transporter substrate-binding protein [Aestuariicella hydrocarbonica]NHO65677.1 putative selenate ABC transporter substrate-binding protein [Aestuariicella hydrocarbonica]
MSIVRCVLVKALLLPLLIILPVLAQAETFVFTAIPDEDESRLQQRFGKVADYLSDQLGVEVRYIPVKSYAAAITAFRNDQVQLAWFGGLSGVQARRLVPGAEALAQGFEDQFFKTYFIAHKSAGIEPGAELAEAVKGKTFTFGSKGSTSGRLMPEYYLRQAFSAAPADIFSRVGFSGDHSRTIAQVQSGAYQLGAVNYAVWENMLKQGDINEDKVQVIWTTPTYPDYQWSIRGDVDQRFGQGFKEKVRTVLLEMTDPELLASFPRKSFVPANNSDYAPIEATAKAIGLIDQ